MGRVLTSFVVAFACVIVASSADTANAQGIHVGAGPVHVDVGYPHHSHYGYAPYGYGGRRAYGAYRAEYRRAWGGHVDWHDTTHYDYHPGGFEPHFNHLDYVPRHYDVHHSGHWDAHH